MRPQDTTCRDAAETGTQRQKQIRAIIALGDVVQRTWPDSPLAATAKAFIEKAKLVDDEKNSAIAPE